MFTGIIETVGTVGQMVRQEEKARMRVDCDPGFGSFELGESIAVNGVCLTVCDSSSHTFAVDLSTETLNRTSFSQVAEGTRVNLERALTPRKSMSGHFVMGHVDQVGQVVQIQPKTGEVLYRFEHPPELTPYFIEKGSVTVDGISLTAFDCKDHQFTVSIIPFTLEHTNLGDRKIGDRVNLECDMIGKYVVKTCQTLFNPGDSGQPLSLEFLKQHGFT